MKVFKVIAEHDKDNKIMRETQFVTSDANTLKSVVENISN